MRTLEAKLREKGEVYDYIMIDLPPSFGGLVRSALYSSDHLIIPCTSDTFSEYYIGLIAQMLPQFISDWNTGIGRFKQNNYGLKDYDGYGRPVFSGWIFNGFDTRDKKMLRADKAHYENINEAIENLSESLQKTIKDYNPVMEYTDDDFNIGQVEDMNVLIQNSLWQSVPASKLAAHKQVKDLTGDRAAWSASQIELIGKVENQIHDIAQNIINNFE
ncbi:ParA family protein [Methylobacterium sp. WL6]|uniref:ParA family protein n=1 Tax=Methylobacterium sp. WL6 TaxID=2603901 RepID=UPI002484C10E|nr:ParA family protein [Methylobacterium sp. WL6]